MNPIEEVSEQEIAPAELATAEVDTELQRWLAIAQQVKDSVIIFLMLTTGMLIFGVLFGIAIPGLVLYFQRWKLVPEGASQERGGWLWLLTLVHELIWTVIFGVNQQSNDSFIIGHLEIGYGLGALISLFALLNSGWATLGKRQ